MRRLCLLIAFPVTAATAFFKDCPAKIKLDKVR
jgi:hypothetical protein